MWVLSKGPAGVKPYIEIHNSMQKNQQWEENNSFPLEFQQFDEKLYN
jgi:hypothetical protein